MYYEKLKDDLIKAKKAAVEAGRGEDGGTANMDSVFLRLPGRREDKVLETIEAAGLYCRGKTKWIGMGYMLSPPVGGIANARTRAMEAMKKSLRQSGYDVLGFYQMD